MVKSISQTSFDHLLVLLESRWYVLASTRTTFKVENAWFHNPKYYGIVDQSWRRSEGMDIAIWIHRCGKELAQWG